MFYRRQEVGDVSAAGDAAVATVRQAVLPAAQLGLAVGAAGPETRRAKPVGLSCYGCFGDRTLMKVVGSIAW
jgi:hypothetical protein